MTLEETMQRLISKIENSNGQWIKPFNNSMPRNFISNTSYNGINIFNLWDIAEEKGYSTNNWATFKQIRSKKGTVNKGEKGTNIFFFKPIQIKEENETGEEEIKMVPLLKSYLVFNLDQTNIESVEDNKDILELNEFINEIDIEIKTSNNGAYYSPSSDYINMPHINTFKSSELYYATLLHEMAHATGHENRLNRDLDSGKMTGTEEELKAYAKEELIAETTRAFLQVELNLNTTEMETQNALYLKSWLKPLKEDPKMLWQIFSQASKAFNYLLNEATIENKEVKAS